MVIPHPPAMVTMTEYTRAWPRATEPTRRGVGDDRAWDVSSLGAGPLGPVRKCVHDGRHQFSFSGYAPDSATHSVGPSVRNRRRWFHSHKRTQLDLFRCSLGNHPLSDDNGTGGDVRQRHQPGRTRLQRAGCGRCHQCDGWWVHSWGDRLNRRVQQRGHPASARHRIRSAARRSPRQRSQVQGRTRGT